MLYSLNTDPRWQVWAYFNSSVNLIPITKLTDEQWAAYHKLRLSIRARYNPAAAAISPVRTTDYFRTHTLDTASRLQAIELVLFKYSPPTAMGWTRFIHEGNSFTGTFDYFADEIPTGFIRIFAQGMLHWFANCPGQYAILFHSDDRLIHALRKLGPMQDIRFNQLILKTEAFNNAALATWRDEFVAASQGLTFEYTENLPHHIREDYVRLTTEFIQDLPLGENDNLMTPTTLNDLQRLQDLSLLHNNKVLILFLLDAEGQRIGLTELTVTLDSGKAIQGFTGLRRNYRGRGLAKALKAEMLFQATSNFPTLKYITTTTNPHNLRMMHINQALGFVLEKTSSQMTFTKQNVEDYLAGSKLHPTNP